MAVPMATLLQLMGKQPMLWQVQADQVRSQASVGRGEACACRLSGDTFQGLLYCCTLLSLVRCAT